MKITYTSFSEAGLKRQENQDSLFCQTDGTAGLFLVADGMGGHLDGAYASRIIKSRASDWWNRYRRLPQRPDFLTSVEELKKFFSDANKEIYDNTVEGNVCGSTLVALWLDHDAWAVFSCGDSRCYQAWGRIFKRKFFHLTTDDVWENQPENIRGMTMKEVESHKNYGRLVKAVGAGPDFQCSVQSSPCRERAVFLLCSDGIYKYCPDAILKRLCFYSLASGKLDAAAWDIRRQVFQNGAGDNLSLILVAVDR